VARGENVLGIRPLNGRTLHMSTFVSVNSVCGAVTTTIDMYDLELNQHGVICCDNCESIVSCREAWNFMYSVPLYVNLSRVLELNK
jgi:hypothetical protein